MSGVYGRAGDAIDRLGFYYTYIPEEKLGTDLRYHF